MARRTPTTSPRFLSERQPALLAARRRMQAMLLEHLRLTTDEVLARLQGNWAADVAAYDQHSPTRPRNGGHALGRARQALPEAFPLTCRGAAKRTSRMSAMARYRFGCDAVRAGNRLCRRSTVPSPSRLLDPESREWLRSLRADGPRPRDEAVARLHACSCSAPRGSRSRDGGRRCRTCAATTSTTSRSQAADDALVSVLRAARRLPRRQPLHHLGLQVRAPRGGRQAAEARVARPRGAARARALEALFELRRPSPTRQLEQSELVRALQKAIDGRA